MAETITIEVARYRPEQEAEPTLQSYEVPFNKDWVVLDALNYIKDHVDGSLSFRWSCRMGVCGSCGMTVNGEPKLTCATFLSHYHPGPIRVEPLQNFPVVRDLVIEMTDFMEKLQSVKPWIVREDDPAPAEGEFLQTPEQLDQYKQFSMCINCMICYAACPVYGLDPQFVGPAAIALAQRYNLDSRDQGEQERMDVLSQHEGIWGCTFVGECTEVCPKNVDPAGAIQQYKLAAHPGMVQVLPDALEQAMKPSPAYSQYHPKWHRTRLSTLWWSRKWSYLKFMLRELSSVFVAFYVVILLPAASCLEKRARGLPGVPAMAQGPVAGDPQRHRLSFRALSRGYLGST